MSGYVKYLLLKLAYMLQIKCEIFSVSYVA